MENNMSYSLIAACVLIYVLFGFLLLFLKKKLKNPGSMKFVILLPIMGGFLVGTVVLLYAISSL